MTPAVDVLVVDDHELFGQALSHVLRATPGVARVDRAASLAAARAAATARRPDAVLLDLHLDGEDGRDLLPFLAATSPPTPAIMLSGSTVASEIADSLSAGARGWVSKEAPLDRVLAALERVRAGHWYLCPDALDVVLDELLARAGSAGPPPSFLDHVTQRQLDVLRCLMTGMTKAEVAGRLYLSSNTVRTHVQHLMTAADVHSTPALVSAARAAGLEVTSPGPPADPARLSAGSPSRPAGRVGSIPAQRRPRED